MSAMGSHSALVESVAVLSRRCKQYEDEIASLREQLEEAQNR